MFIKLQQIDRPIQRLVMIAILSTISFILMVVAQIIVPFLPATASFLRIDVSILPILIPLVLLDLQASIFILFVRSVLKLLLFNEGITTWIGLPINMLAIISFILVWYYILKLKDDNWKKYLYGTVLSIVALTVTMLIANIFIALPLYSLLMNFDFIQLFGSLTIYVFTALIPFNIIEGTIWCILFIALLNYAKKQIKV